MEVKNTGKVPAIKKYSTGTVTSNKQYTAGTVPANKKYTAGTLKKLKFLKNTPPTPQSFP